MTSADDLTPAERDAAQEVLLRAYLGRQEPGRRQARQWVPTDRPRVRPVLPFVPDDRLPMLWMQARRRQGVSVVYGWYRIIRWLVDRR